jgi:Uma2 family endonuclease
MPVLSTTRMTAPQFLQLGQDPPGVRLELVEGEIAVSPSPTPKHSYAVIQLCTILNVHILEHDLGELYQDVDTILDRYNVRRPDILFFSKDRLHLVGEQAMLGAPDLAVEVISPSSVQIDREDKFAQYAAAGVGFYWIVDPAGRTLEGWRLEQGRYIPTGRAQGTETLNLPPFEHLSLPLEKLWFKRG